MTATDATSTHPTGLDCPSCGQPTVTVFYEVDDVPTNSVLLLDTAEEAMTLPTGDIAMGHCSSCGHVHNTAFDPKLTEYSGRYESTQAYSGTFNAFHRRLAEDMIERFDLHGKEIIEIGCGNGEFLVFALRDRRQCRPRLRPGVPARSSADAGRHRHRFRGRLLLAEVRRPSGRPRDVQDDPRAHRSRPATSSATSAHRSVTASTPSCVSRSPTGANVLGDLAFWDVYYEHCSTFTHGSLARLFRQEGFDVTDLWTDYDDQYLVIAATPTEQPTEPSLPAEDDPRRGGRRGGPLRRRGAQAARRMALVPDRAARGWGKTVVLWGRRVEGRGLPHDARRRVTRSPRPSTSTRTRPTRSWPEPGIASSAPTP